MEDKRELSAKEKQIHSQGLVGVLKELHDELDAAVLQAYGWEDLALRSFDKPTTGQAQGERNGEATDTLLQRLLALNIARAAEEQLGTVRWLRPAFQQPNLAQNIANNIANSLQTTQQSVINFKEQSSENTDKSNYHTLPSGTQRKSGTKSGTKSGIPSEATAWPTALPDQVRAVAALLASAAGPLSVAEIEARFTGRGNWKTTLPRILETLEVLGRAQRVDGMPDQAQRWRC